MNMKSYSTLSWLVPVAALLLGGCGQQGTSVKPNMQAQSVSCSAWSASEVYLAGDTVTRNGTTYRANWWNQNNDPTIHNGGPGSGQPWTVSSGCTTGGGGNTGGGNNGDTTAPTVSLSATPTTVTTPGNVSLSATASDNVGVTKVEFFDGATLLGTDTSAPFTWTQAVTAANNGFRTYIAKAFDAAGNTTTATATVSINIPGSGNGGGGTPGGATSGAIYVGYAGTWKTSINDLTTSTIPSYYTDVNLAFVRPDTTYTSGSNNFNDVVTGLQFVEGASTFSGAVSFTPAQAQTLKNNIAALKARGTRVWLSVGGWKYSQGNAWSRFNARNIVDLATDLGADGVDIDWESSGSNCNKAADAEFSCSKDAEIKEIISSLDSEISSRASTLQISIAGWSTGAYYVKGTPYEEGKVQWGSPFGGTMYRVVRDLGSKIDRVNLMSYDGGTYYDPREGYESYRAIYGGPIAMGLEVAPEGSGGAVLKLNAAPGTVYDAEMNTGQNNDATKYYNVETLATYMKNRGRPGDGMMVWQIWKERVHAKAPADAANVNSTGQKVCQLLSIRPNCTGAVPDLPPAQ